MNTRLESEKDKKTGREKKRQKEPTDANNNENKSRTDGLSCEGRDHRDTTHLNTVTLNIHLQVVSFPLPDL